MNCAFVFQLIICVIFSGLIAGGVTGAILAALLSALLIYTWKSKHGGGFILGKLVHREEAGV